MACPVQASCLAAPAQVSFVAGRLGAARNSHCVQAEAAWQVVYAGGSCLAGGVCRRKLPGRWCVHAFEPPGRCCALRFSFSRALSVHVARDADGALRG